MTSKTPSLLSVRELVVRHRASGHAGAGLTAVREVSLDVAPGSIHALVGESGSGKTSLARAVLCLLPADTGEIHFQGRNLAGLSPRELRAARRGIQAVFQDPLAALSPRRTILQSLIEPLRQYRIGTRSDRATRANALLEAVGLDPTLGRRYPHELSGGQCQRVCVARALAAEPELIVADEPVASLDRSTRTRILDLLRTLRDRRGLAFLLVSHDLADVRRVADHVSVMYAGTLVETGPAESVFRSPSHPYTQCLLAAVPTPDPEAPAPRVLGGEPPSALTPPGGCVFHRRCAQRLALCAERAPPDFPATPSQPEHIVRCHLCRK